MDAAYNLALWLTRDDSNAQDIVQEAALRAFRFFEQFDGRDPRAWFLTIVRNSFYSWVRKNRPQDQVEDSDEELQEVATEAPSPEVEVMRSLDRQKLWDAMGRLSMEIRESLILREFEGFSYREIATMMGVPIGTVMSRLSRGRNQLQLILCEQKKKEATS